ncbi:MAG TPA: type I-E CRISPR-associated protein Cas6/Cse3/CasE [Anaerolineae bacterium]|nr:type I-E CRISPR-associated protein Cas6/Cse3/CasE [Anaerolineae bacterium]
MYLSRLLLNNRSRYLWRSVIEQPYKLHQIVMSGFPDGVKRADANVLHRLDMADTAVTLLVQSDIQPDWSRLDERLLLPASPFDPVPNPAVKKINGLPLDNGRILRFRLRANPTKRLSSGKGNKPGKRVQLFHEEEQLAWLKKRAAANGFSLIDVQIIPEGNQTDRRKRLTIYTVQYDGRLQITDADKFREALQKGIGPAKAFGCGLLSIAPG